MFGRFHSSQLNPIDSSHMIGLFTKSITIVVVVVVYAEAHVCVISLCLTGTREVNTRRD